MERINDSADEKAVRSRFIGILSETAFIVMPEQYDVALKDLGLDSLHFVELVMEIEKAFDIIILDEEAAMLRTVNDFTEFITNRTAI
jgi:acyl carrier protein